MRRLAVVLAGGLLVGALAAAGTRAEEPTSAVALHARTLEADGAASFHATRLARAATTYRGGPTTTSTGETVDVLVSDALPVETATPEKWAEFFAGLIHGPELSQLTTYVVTFDEMQDICGTQALGCYARNQLVVPGETAFDTSPEEVARHEYGHHIALHRSNAPWVAIDWGPKRWASAANVCSRVTRKEAYPGDEGSNYARNPGEAWAEVYRLADERKAGITTATWPIISPSFYPDATALDAAELDVVQPWTARHTTLFTHVFGKGTAKVWWIPLSTPLDGDVRISATVPGRGVVDVALVASNRRTIVRRAQWVSQRVKRLDGSICGQRSLFVRVTETGLQGRIRVSVTTA
jgi:hypothetical protein